MSYRITFHESIEDSDLLADFGGLSAGVKARLTQVLLETEVLVRRPSRLTQVLLEIDWEEAPPAPPVAGRGRIDRIGAPQGRVAPWRWGRPTGGRRIPLAVMAGHGMDWRAPEALPVVLTPRLQRRDFGADLATPQITMRLERQSWRAIGGPHLARIRVGGDITALWGLAEALRCPVELLDDHGEPRWWGYVAEVEVRVGGIALSVTLDSMANRIAVAYAYVTEGDVIGSRATTSWAQDDESVAEYGTVERMESSSGDDSATAAALRDTTLAQLRWPQASLRVTPGGREVGATLHCRGWWDTLRWRYYDNPATEGLQTTAQIAAIVAEAEFLGGTLVETDDAVEASQYQDGDQSAQSVIEALLARGTSNDRRLLAQVTRERYLRVYEEPAAGASDYFLLASGALRTAFDTALAPGQCPAGVWARLKDVLPASIDMVRLAEPELVMLEETEWDEALQRVAAIGSRGAAASLMGVEPL